MKLDGLDIVIPNAGMFKVCVIFHPDAGYEESTQVNVLSNALLLLHGACSEDKESP
jgi:hypothetical protein